MLGVVLALGSAVLASARPAPVQAEGLGVAFTPTPKSVECGPGDRPETGLQGEIPAGDRQSGRSALGYSCNLTQLSQLPAASFANFDTYGDCAYWTDNRAGGGMAEGGAFVADLSDPTRPVQTDHLTATAMGNGGESLRVNQARGLLVSDHYNSLQQNPDQTRYVHALAVYDVSQDCRHPKLLADVIMPNAEGHEGCFQPDGMVYYMASTRDITPIDLSDPAHPVELTEPWPFRIHGCSVSDDGRRGYLSDIAHGRTLVVDTSQVQDRVKGAKPRVLGTFDTPDNQIKQSSYPLRYGDRRYLFDWSELTGTGARPCAPDRPNFGYGAMVDLADEAHPREVSRLVLQVHDPAHCALVVRDRQPQPAGRDHLDVFFTFAGSAFTYDFHYCRPDRLHEPTIMACSNFGSGLRVFDIRDPARPTEIAYFNAGTVGSDPPVADWAVSPPVIRRDLGQIWWVTTYGGLHVAAFRPGVWPFPGDDPCPSPDDYFAVQYGGCSLRRPGARVAVAAVEFEPAAPAVPGRLTPFRCVVDLAR
jgi:hypothetical protein